MSPYKKSAYSSVFFGGVQEEIKTNAFDFSFVEGKESLIQLAMHVQNNRSKLKDQRHCLLEGINTWVSGKSNYSYIDYWLIMMDFIYMYKKIHDDNLEYFASFLKDKIINQSKTGAIRAPYYLVFYTKNLEIYDFLLERALFLRVSNFHKNWKMAADGITRNIADMIHHDLFHWVTTRNFGEFEGSHLGRRFIDQIEFSTSERILDEIEARLSRTNKLIAGIEKLPTNIEKKDLMLFYFLIYHESGVSCGDENNRYQVKFDSDNSLKQISYTSKLCLDKDLNLFYPLYWETNADTNKFINMLIPFSRLLDLKFIDMTDFAAETLRLLTGGSRKLSKERQHKVLENASKVFDF